MSDYRGNFCRIFRRNNLRNNGTFGYFTDYSHQRSTGNKHTIHHRLPLLRIFTFDFSLVLWIRRQKTDDNTSSLENKLSAVESKSDVVINAIDDGVLAISKDGNIELINPSAQQIIGWDQGDALGLNWKSVLKLVTSDGKDVEDLENPIAQSLSKKPANTQR